MGSVVRHEQAAEPVTAPVPLSVTRPANLHEAIPIPHTSPSGSSVMPSIVRQAMKRSLSADNEPSSASVPSEITNTSLYWKASAICSL